MFFDYLAIRINSKKAAGKRISINFSFTDVKEYYSVRLENSVLSYTPNKHDDKADCTVRMTRELLNRIIQGDTTMTVETFTGKIRMSGDVSAVQRVFGMMDTFHLWFNLVTPNPMPAE
jgi:alkyl sulfatase BDS1-like metallo-beta-lactamase superfamily hydrolase